MQGVYPNPVVQLFEGNIVAIIALAGIVGFIVLLSLLVLIWWKMPQPGKRSFMNNLIGGLPFVATAYDNKRVLFHTPRMFRGGIAHSRDSGWHIFPRLDTGLEKDLNLTEQNAMTGAFTIEGAQGSFFMEYAGKGQIMNPELLYLVQYEKDIQKMQAMDKKRKGDGGRVRIPKQDFIDALNTMEDKEVIIDPVYITWRLDPTKIKAKLSKAYSKSQLGELENEIMQYLRGELTGFGSKGGILLFIGIIDLILSVVIVLKSLNAF